MGGYTALMLAAKFPERVLSCTAAGAGSGALKSTRAQFIEDTRQRAAAFERAGKIDAEAVALNPTRVQLQNKDRMGWRTFVAHLAEHPAHAAAKTLRTVQAGRASLYDLEAELKSIEAPILLLVGDEDEPCLDVNLWMKRLMANVRLAFLPGSGHAINLEEPALFNQLTEQFIADVDRGSWRARDPRAAPVDVKSVEGDGPAAAAGSSAAQCHRQRAGVAAILGDVVLKEALEERRHPEAKDHGVPDLVGVAIFGQGPAHVVAAAVGHDDPAVHHHPRAAAHGLVCPFDACDLVFRRLRGGVAPDETRHAGKIGRALLLRQPRAIFAQRI
jgi:hypothetical protein